MVVAAITVAEGVVMDSRHRAIVLSSFYDELEVAGDAPATRVLSLDLIEPTPELVEAFGTTDPLWEILRLRSTRFGPLAVMHNWVPGSVSGLSLESLANSGLYALLRAAGAQLRVARQQIGATVADAEVAELLGIELGSPCVSMRRMSFAADGRLEELGEHIYRGDTYQVESTIVTR